MLCSSARFQINAILTLVGFDNEREVAETGVNVREQPGRQLQMRLFQRKIRVIDFHALDGVVAVVDENVELLGATSPKA